MEGLLMEVEDLKIVVGDFIKEVTLEEFGQLLIYYNFQTVFYAEIDKEGILVKFTVREDTRILADGRHVVRIFIPIVLFVRVEGPRRMFVYNHVQNQTYYGDHTDQFDRPETTHIFLVFRYPDILLEEVVKKIKEKLRSGANKK